MSYQRHFRVESSKSGNTTSIAIAGELDGSAAEALMSEFERAIADGTAEQLTIDMERISFIDSAGLRAIIQIERRARESEVPIVLNPPPAPVTAIMRTTGMGDRLSLGPQVGGALNGDYLERVDLDLDCNPTAPGRARAELRSAVRSSLNPDQLEIATLLTSELVTNAVIHPDQHEGSIGLRIVTAERQLRVVVTDSGSGFDPARPEPRAPDRGGRGLLLVDRLASRWGAGRVRDETDPRFFVWFELDLASNASAVAAQTQG